MTDTHVTDWAMAFESYQAAATAWQAELRRSDKTQVDPNDEIDTVHRRAGLILLSLPARNIAQIAQKVRVAENVFDLDSAFVDLPNLPHLLLADLLALDASNDIGSSLPARTA